MFFFSVLRRLFATEARLDKRARLRPRTLLRLEPLEDRMVLSPTVLPGYEINALATGGPLAGQHLAGIVADPKSGNLYAAADQIDINGFNEQANQFNLYRITPAGAVSLVGTYDVPHIDLVKMAWNPNDGKIYLGNYSTDSIDTIDPNSGSFGVYSSNLGVGFGRYGLNFDSSGNLIFSPEEDYNFYKILPGSGSEFLGTTNPLPPNYDHGDSFGIQPNGNYVVYSDLWNGPNPVNNPSPMNDYALNTAGHTPGSNYSTAWVGTTDLQTIYSNGTNDVAGYSNGAIDPVTGNVYSITSNVGEGISTIAFTPATGGASSAFVSNIGNGVPGSPFLNDGGDKGVTDLAFGSRTDGKAGESLFFADTYTNTIYEVRGATPTFDSLSSPTITYGDPSVTLSGHIALGTASVPPGNLNITLNGVTQAATIDPSTGDFSSVFTTSSLGASSSPYTITYAYSTTSDFGMTAKANTTLTVQKAMPTVSVADASGTYNGSTFPATATVAGVDGKAASVLETVGLTLDYQQLDASGNSIKDLGSIAPTGAGSYKVTASFAGSADYTSASALTNFTIAKATPTVSVHDAGGTYNGTAFAASDSVVGVDSTPSASLENVSPTLAYYQGTYTSVAQLSGLTALSGAPINAGSYTVVASFAGSADYTSAGALTNFTIAKATPIVSVSDAGGFYNGKPFPATATVAGVVSGVDNTLAASLEDITPTLSYFAGSSASGTALAGAPTTAGIYTVVASFAGSTDYTAASNSVTFTIAKATTSFSNLAAPQIVLGTGTTTLSGTLTSNTIVPAGQSVSITVNGVTQTATVATDGTFSTSFNTSALGVGSYVINYSYSGDTNFTAASGNGSLTVAYGTQLLFDNSKTVHAGSALPVKLELTDASGADVSSSNIAVTATSLVGPNGAVSLSSEGNANPNNLFRYDPSLGGYIFNLDTKGFASGTYTLSYTAGNDPTVHSLTFVVS